MAASTTVYDVTEAAWTEVHADAGDCTIQLLSNGGVWVHVAVAEPAADATGMRLYYDKDRSIAIAGLIAGDSVWVRAQDDHGPQEVSVINVPA
jgi:hypothetical protein